MAWLTLEAVVPFSCTDVFNAASAFERYPEYFSLINKVKIREMGRRTARIEFGFDKNSDLLPPGLKRLLPPDMAQTSRIRLFPEREISGEGVYGLLKKVAIKCEFNAETADTTKVQFEMQFRTGYGFLVDWPAKWYIQRRAPAIIANLQEGVAGFIKEKKSNPGPG